MFSSTTSSDAAITLRDVSKVYRLYDNHWDQLIDVFGLSRLGFKPRSQFKNFNALRGITLDVPRGARIGIVGRNGAGKTTLLKLICGNFKSTSGHVRVNGVVQALMSAGLGFHPEYTGRENVVASLEYNGLTVAERATAMEEIIEFCELGDFFDQPLRTYSLGMKARLMFAAATAVKPDILIVDEVLGAGDAYFVAKSRRRVEKLISSGCTMLLVSHSMSQVLELCDQAIWLYDGEVRMQGTAFDVVKAYEEFLHGPIMTLKQDLPDDRESLSRSIQADPSPEGGREKREFKMGTYKLQEPAFLPHGQLAQFPDTPAPTGFRFQAPGGITRWDGTGELKILGATLVSDAGECSDLTSMCPTKFQMTLVAEQGGDFGCRYAFVIYDHLGRCVLDIVSPEDRFSCGRGEIRLVEMVLNPLQLGPGEYTLSVSVHAYETIEVFNSSQRYDLVSRSLAFSVKLPESLQPIEAQFYHSAEWRFPVEGEGKSA